MQVRIKCKNTIVNTLYMKINIYLCIFTVGLYAEEALLAKSFSGQEALIIFEYPADPSVIDFLNQADFVCGVCCCPNIK